MNRRLSHDKTRAAAGAHARAMGVVGTRNALLPGGSQQRGVALVVALILLIIITLVGLAAIRGTVMQQMMAANLYDRQVAFQNAEAALRVATARIATNPADIARNCQAGGVYCQANPFTDPNFDLSKVVTVTSGTGAGLFQASSIATGQPQYVIENMGNWQDPNTSTGYNQSANAHNYGAQGLSTTVVYYRITARSGDPTANSGAFGDRAIVTLQAMVKQG